MSPIHLYVSCVPSGSLLTDVVARMPPCGLCRCSSVRTAWLAVFVVAYLAAGAAVFRYLETAPEMTIRSNLRERRNEFIETNACVAGRSSLNDFISHLSHLYRQSPQLVFTIGLQYCLFSGHVSYQFVFFISSRVLSINLRLGHPLLLNHVHQLY